MSSNVTQPIMGHVWCMLKKRVPLIFLPGFFLHFPTFFSSGRHLYHRSATALRRQSIARER